MEAKIININRNLSLLDDLEVLTDPNSPHFDETIASEKEDIRGKILRGEITIDD